MSHHHHHDQPHEHDDMSDVLDLDARVLAASLAEIRADIGRLAEGPVRTFLDLGAGTGTGTVGLLEHFPEARAVAVDGSEEMLGRLRRRARGLGLADRMTAVLADLDAGVPDVGPVDLVWAAASLHHLADPDRTVAEVGRVVRPGGLVAVLELTGFPRFLADGTPEGEVEAAVHAVLAADRAVDMPAMGSDWGARLAAAGLQVELDRPVVVDLPPSGDPTVGEYAFAVLSRVRGVVDGRLGAAGGEQLARLVDGGAADVRRRRDLHVRTERHLQIARRPRA